MNEVIGSKASFLKLITVAILLGSATLLHAGPPYSTDDPEPVGYRHGEVYFGMIHERGPEGSSGAGPFVEFNYGAAENVHLHLILPLAYSRPVTGPNTYGFGDVELGVKLRFVQEEGGMPMVGTFPLIEVPSGSEEKGLGAGYVHAYLPLWIQKSFGSWTTYAGGGYWINPGPRNSNYAFFGWQVQRQFSKQLALGGEVFHTTADTLDGVGTSRFNVGMVLDITKSNHFLVSAGHSFTGYSMHQAYFAYQFTF